MAADQGAPGPAGTITAIEPQVHDPSRVSIFLDGRFAFGLRAAIALGAGLREGDHLDAGRVASLLDVEAFESALQIALGYLSYRPRSVAEVRRHVERKGYSAGTVEAVIQRLVDWHYLDDDAFAHAWVENRRRFRPRGPRMLRAELRHKGVGDETVHRAIAGAAGDERALATAAAQVRLPALRAADYVEFNRKLGGFLARRGFSGETVWHVVKEQWAERAAGEHAG